MILASGPNKARKPEVGGSKAHWRHQWAEIPLLPTTSNFGIDG